MKISIAAVGLIVLAGTGMLVKGAGPRQQGAAPAGTQPVSQQPATGRPATPAAGAAAPQEKPLGDSPEEKALLAGVDAFANAYSSANAQALSDMFLEDGSVIDPEGNATRGKAAISEMYATSFQASPGLKIEPKVEEIRFLTPDVARVDGNSRLSSAKSDASDFTRFSTLLVRRDSNWFISEIREYGVRAEDITPAERLKEIAWMVGDWVDESDNNRVQASVRWADGQSYLIRTYTVEMQGEKSSSGTMFIGWDPQSGQIKSWVFDSGGGHGEGLWTRTGDKEWVVKAQGVLPDGRPNSATHIHTIINKDSVKTNAIDRIIGGQVAPDVVDVIMVRKPPRPAATAPR